MAELNQNKNLKQPDRPDAVWKLYFTLEIKTFHTCSKESLFLRYKKISKIVVKLGSFLQCSAQIFLGHDDCFWKINVIILWNYIMKNFKVKYSQCTTSYSPKHFFLKAVSSY